jgi:predicted transposase/invertase (TIGR01784 family)
MPKFNKSEGELVTLLDKWLYALKHLSEFKKRPKVLSDKIFDKLFEEAELSKLSKEERMEYEESLKVMRDNKNVIDYAKMVSFEEGEAKGKLEGKLEGKIEVVLNALKKGFPVKVIAEMTGLSEKEIRVLQKK